MKEQNEARKPWLDAVCPTRSSLHEVDRQTEQRPLGFAASGRTFLGTSA
jgi:hypothetical protein